MRACRSPRPRGRLWTWGVASIVVHTSESSTRHWSCGNFTVDLLWPEHRVVFEIDGFNFQTSRFAFDRDKRKDLALRAAGFGPHRLSRDQVMFQPSLSIAAIAGALARASLPLPVSARLS